MNKKTWYILLLCALVVVIWAIWRYSAKGPAVVSAPNNADNAGQTQLAPAQNQSLGNVWLGTLRASDNPKKGNLMLMTDKTTVYISTSRDFSDLVGKPVKVTYQGTLDSFELGDITAQ